VHYVQLVKPFAVLQQTQFKFTRLDHSRLRHEGRESRMCPSWHIVKQSVSLVITAEVRHVSRVVEAFVIAVVDVGIADVVVECRVQSVAKGADYFPGSVDCAGCVLTVGVLQRLCEHTQAINSVTERNNITRNTLRFATCLYVCLSVCHSRVSHNSRTRRRKKPISG